MADVSALTAIPGLDSDTLAQLQGYLKLMQPTEEDKRRAQLQALASAGFALMGTPKGAFWMGLGRAGNVGLQQYGQDVTQQQAQRGQNVGQAMQMAALGKQLQNQRLQAGIIDQYKAALGIGGAAPTQPGPPQGFQLPGGANALMQGAASGAIPDVSNAFASGALGGNPALINSLPTRVAAPPATPNRQDLARLNFMGKMAGLPDQTDTLKFMFPDQIPGRAGAFMYDPGSGKYTYLPQGEPGSTFIADPTAPGGFRAVPIEGGEAAIKAAAAAKEGGKEAGGLPYKIVQTTGPGNAPVSGYAPNVYGPPPVPQQTGAPGASQAIINQRPGVPPYTQQELAWATAQNGGVAPTPFVTGGAGGGNVTGMTRAEEKAQDVSSGAYTASNADWVTNDYRPAVTAAAISRRANTGLDALEKNPITKQTGMFTTFKAQISKILSGAGVSPEKTGDLAANAEMFARAVYEHNWQLLQQQKGVQTEGDAQRALAVFVQLGNRPEANQFIIDFTRAQNNLDVKKADFYAANRAAAAQKGDYAGLADEWNAKQPSLWEDPAMQKWKSMGEPKQGAQQKPTQSAQSAPAGKTIVNRGTGPDGRRYVKYSDGTVAPE